MQTPPKFAPRVSLAPLLDSALEKKIKNWAPGILTGVWEGHKLPLWGGCGWLEYPGLVCRNLKKAGNILKAKGKRLAGASTAHQPQRVYSTLYILWVPRYQTYQDIYPGTRWVRPYSGMSTRWFDSYSGMYPGRVWVILGYGTPKVYTVLNTPLNFQKEGWYIYQIRFHPKSSNLPYKGMRKNINPDSNWNRLTLPIEAREKSTDIPSDIGDFFQPRDKKIQRNFPSRDEKNRGNFQRKNQKNRRNFGTTDQKYRPLQTKGWQKKNPSSI